MKLIAEEFKDKTNEYIFILFMKYLTFIGKKHILYQIHKILIINYINDVNNKRKSFNYITVTNIVNDFQHLTNEFINQQQWEDYILKITINKTKKQILRDFLYQYKALEKFNDNLKQHSVYKNVDELIKSTKCKRIETMIDFAFTWKQTKQGFDYWSNLDDKYRHYIYYNLREQINEKINEISNNNK